MMKRKLSQMYDEKNFIDNGNIEIMGNYDVVLILNFCGTKFTLGRETILSKPDSKLAKMMIEQKLLVNHSDGLHSKQYYFDRNPNFFLLIQEWYCTGILPLFKVKIEDYDLLYEE